MKQVDDMPTHAIHMMPLVNELADVLGVDREIAKQVYVKSYFEAERKVLDEHIG